MKILVPFKSVPDPYAGPSGAAKSVINPFDEIAIEEALRMRERGDATEITGVTIGVAAVDEQIRSALAMGVDRALRIEDARALDPYAIARILCALVKKEAPQVVMMGKQAVDDDSNQAGQMLAGLLGWPQATFVSKIEFLEGKTHARCTALRDHNRPAVERAALRLPPRPDEGAEKTDRSAHLRATGRGSKTSDHHTLDRAAAEAHCGHTRRFG